MLQNHYQVKFIESIVKDSLGAEATLVDFTFLYCGNFNLAALVKTKTGKYFVKWNKGDFENMFESEAKSIELIRKTNTINVPNVYGYGKKPDGTFLMIDFVPETNKKINYWSNFGEQLAGLHHVTNNKHGLHFNNYVGTQFQDNSFIENGIDFFINKRLKPQFEIAKNAKEVIESELFSNFEAIYKVFEKEIPVQKASLLHGDLWSGNMMINADGHASVVDPSAYFGMAEAEIAFTTLFGGFNKNFYEAYLANFKFEPNFKSRIDLYNLYPLLAHYNTFGGGYFNSIVAILKKYLK